MIASAEIAWTQVELAQAMGVSRRTVADWCTDPTFPRDRDGSFNVAAVRQWRSLKNKRGSEDEPGDEELGKLAIRFKIAETRKMEEEARFKKLKNDENEGRLIDAFDEQQRDAERMLRIKSRLESFPDEIQGIFAAEYRAEARRAAENFIHELLLEMSGWAEEEERHEDAA